MVAKGIFDGQLLECHFARSLYKIILGNDLTFEDLEDFDPILYNNLSKILKEENVENLCLVFTYSKDNFDKGEDVELIEGGSSIDVTNENKHEYVQKYVYYVMYGIVRRQIDFFLKGFYEVISKDLISIFTYKELEILIAGLHNFEVADLKANT